MDRGASDKDGVGPSLKVAGISRNQSPSSSLSFWVTKSVNFLKNKARVPSRSSSRRYNFDGMVVNNSVYCDSPECVEERMEAPANGSEVRENEEHGVECKSEKCGELNEEESGASSSSSDYLASEANLCDENCSSQDSSSPPLDWEMQKDNLPNCGGSEVSEEVEKPSSDNRKLTKQGSCISGSDFFWFFYCLFLQ